MFGQAFWEVVWDLVRLLLVPVASAAAIFAVRWLHLQVQKTALGRRLQVDDAAARALARYIIEAEHIFGKAKSVENAKRAKAVVIEQFQNWLKAFRLEDHYTAGDASAMVEWMLERLGLYGRKKQAATMPVIPPITRPPIKA